MNSSKVSLGMFGSAKLLLDVSCDTYFTLYAPKKNVKVAPKYLPFLFDSGPNICNPININLLLIDFKYNLSILSSQR